MLLCSSSKFKENIIKKWFMSKLEIELEIELVLVSKSYLTDPRRGCAVEGAVVGAAVAPLPRRLSTEGGA